MSGTPRERADVALVNRGLVESRARAQALIMAGVVFQGEERVAKAGQAVREDAPLEVRGRDHPWVSRGGLKLAHALEHFAIDPAGLVVIDVGASTGGFTDVLLTRGAARVYAVDVGHGQLAWKLQSDPRVVVLDRTNARSLTAAQVPEPVDMVVCDASFIGLKTVLPAALALARPGAWAVALIKPQFEVGRGRLGKGGVVRDPALHEAVCEDIRAWLDGLGVWRVEGVTESPITGPEGNREFLIAARRWAMPEAAPIVVEIERLGAQGDGMAHAVGHRLIVPFTLPGERAAVRVEGRRGDGDLAVVVDLLAPSAHRVEPVCPHFGICGGCSLQHAGPAFLAEWRSAQIAEALARVGLDVPLAEPIRAWGRGRRRTRLAALRLHGGRVLLGYHRRRDKQIVDVAACPQIAPDLLALVAPLRAALDKVLREHEAADIALNTADNGIDLLLIGPRNLPLAARQVLAGLAETRDLARISWQPKEGEPPEPVAIRRAPVVSFGGHAVPLPPDAFLQATKEAEAAMVAYACVAFAGARHVADLYAGCGAFSLPLARVARVTACEAAPAMVEALAQAARAAQLTGRLVVERRDLERRPLQPAELKKLDGVLLDPPRAGAAGQCATLAGSAVPTVVMASCYPPSFARDARVLVDGGYRLTHVQPVDQFGWSHHVELISRFER